MNFEKCKKEFDKYVNTFDMNNTKIHRKYYHTYRVVEYAERVAISEQLNEHDIFLAKVCALLHDIARFRQAKEYDTFNDNLSFDHGDVGYEILLESGFISKFLENEEDIKICLAAVKNHNKYMIEENLLEKEMYFANLTRDSDKLDILDTQKNSVEPNNQNEIFPEIVEYLQKHKLYCKNKNTEESFNSVSIIAMQLSFIFDVRFKESFKIIEEKNMI